MRLLRLLIFPSILILIFQVVYGFSYIHHHCSSSMNFVTNDPFETNLNRLMIYLSSSIAHKSGFNFRSFGKGPYLVYGHALCLSYVSHTLCEDCMIKASNDLRRRCPNKKSAVIWYPDCLLKYSNTEFHGMIDNDYSFVVPFELPEGEPKIPLEETRMLLSQLIDEASENSKRFAVGKLKLKGSRHLYGLAQCTPDLVSSLCKECLSAFIQCLPVTFNESMGAHFVRGSCIMTFDPYPFV